MRLDHIQTALIPRPDLAPLQRRKQRATLANRKDFQSLLDREPDVIEAEFEEMDRPDAWANVPEGQQYKNALFPAFLWKCLYVNYYA